MASLLLDSVINETVRSFRGSELVESALASTRASSNGSRAAELDPLAQVFEMSRAERLFWVALFSLMVLVAAGGNMIVIWIVSTNREMKSVTNYFLVNLSLADTMVSTLNVIFNFTSMLNR